MNIPIKLGSILLGGFRQEDLNVKVYRRRLAQSDDNTSHDLWVRSAKNSRCTTSVFSVVFYLLYYTCSVLGWAVQIKESVKPVPTTMLDSRYHPICRQFWYAENIKSQYCTIYGFFVFWWNGKNSCLLFTFQWNKQDITNSRKSIMWIYRYI